MRNYGQIPYNVDVNQPGASAYPRFSVYSPFPYQEATVEQVIINESSPGYAPDGSNVGRIRVRFIPEETNVPMDKLNTAMPMDPRMTEYPLAGETVIVMQFLGDYYYFRTVGISNKITENSNPGLSRRLSPQPTSQQKSEAAQIAAQGGQAYQISTIAEEKTLGKEFKENQTVRRVRSNEGDLITQGRFGTVVRLGSSLFSNPATDDPKPNLLLTVGQRENPATHNGVNQMYSLVYEDINDDASAIWMVSDEIVEFGAATEKSQSPSKAHLRSSEIPKTQPHYSGAQIFINSDRVVLNSKVNEISLFSNTEINLSALGCITVASERSVILTSNIDITLDAMDDVFINGKRISLVSQEDFSNKSYSNYSILGKKIFIGTSSDTSEPMVLGASLSQFLQQLINIFTTQLPLTTVQVGPTGTGTAFFVPLITALKALQLTQLGITPQSAVFNSSDNFVTKNNSV